MRRGFTLIEMMIALSISAVILTAIGGMLSAVWMISKEASDEVQCALKARQIREQLFYALPGKNQGLISMTEINFANSEFTASRKVKGTVEATWSASVNNATDMKRYCFDVGRNGGSRNKTPLQVVCLKVESKKDGSNKPGYLAYHDRLVIPVFGQHPTSEDLEDCFGM